jgi:hypothetical protein
MKRFEGHHVAAGVVDNPWIRTGKLLPSIRTAVP